MNNIKAGWADFFAGIFWVSTNSSKPGTFR